MAYDFRDCKDLPRKTASNKPSRGKAFNIAKNPSNDWCQRDLVSTVYKFCDRKLATHSGTLITSNSDSKNQQSGANCTSQLLKNLRNLNYIYPYMTIFGVQI